jgi:cbb3-type cytochrome oxidase subunit 1
MSIPSVFFRTAILLAIAGILLGISMGVNQDFRLAHMHAHLNLLGWVSFFIFGGYYSLAPQAAAGVLPKVHYTLCLIGLLVFMAGLISIGLGTEVRLEALAAVGSLLLLAGFLVFAVIIFRTRIAPRAEA